MADGHVKGRYAQLVSIDKDVLINISGRAKHKYTYVNGKRYGIYNSQIDLSDYPFLIDPTKDYRSYYYSLSEEDKDKFVHGFMDGDGSICLCSNIGTIRVIFYLAREVDEEIIKSYLKERGIKAYYGEDTRGHRVARADISNQLDVFKLLRSLYKEGVYLKRKWFSVLRYLKQNNGIRELTDELAGYIYVRGYLEEDYGYIVRQRGNKDTCGFYIGKWSVNKDFCKGVIKSCNSFYQNYAVIKKAKTRKYCKIFELFPQSVDFNSTIRIFYSDIEESGIGLRLSDSKEHKSYKLLGVWIL